jgi:hypothetical protein
MSASKYTVANVPLPIVPTLLYFESPTCAIDCVWRVAGAKMSGYSELVIGRLPFLAIYLLDYR